MNSKFIITSILAVLFISCQNSKNKEEADDNISLTPIVKNESVFVLNLDTAKYQERIPLSAFFKKVHFIPLETNENSLLGRINHLYIKGDTIFILDLVIAKALRMFNKKGKYLGTVGGRGDGPGEYHKPKAFGIDNEYLYLFDSPKQRINYYKLPSMEFSHSFILSPEEDARSRYISIENGRIYADNYFPEESSPYLIREIDENNHIVNKWLSKDTYNRGYLDNNSFTGDNFFHQTLDGIRYNHEMTDSIMQIRQGVVSPYIVFQYKNRPDSKKVQEKVAKENISFSRCMTLLGAVHDIRHYAEGEDYITFSFKRKNFIDRIILNKKNRKFQWGYFMHDMIHTDFRNFTINPLPAFGDKNGIYFYIHPIEMERFVNLIHENKILLPAEDADKLKDLQTDSNPILIYYEVK